VPLLEVFCIQSDGVNAMASMRFTFHSSCITLFAMTTLTSTAENFVSLRLGVADAALMRRLHERMGLSKTEIVKQALRLLASSTEEQVSLYELGQSRFGRYGDASRQSSDIKSVVRARLAAKRPGAVAPAAPPLL
jgi:hypothetical protein